MSLQQTLWAFFGFNGRLSRQAFALAGLLLYVIRSYPIYRLYTAPDQATMEQWASIFLVVLGVLILSHLALAAKRLHDFDRTGWYGLFFIIGDIIVFILLCLPQGTRGANRYGRETNAPA
ncbi:DUF805 domain-containing protein [Mesorhizobium sp. 1M-11]|uniref:DUF805 domain-containing protein n=1 Tax=Mesorhizobium sp. 1M-11 TaxID=1529006 RepID=UPI0006C767DC|nr:DUF805 domain-containing protein [Mesorhizobium sp. 1M-11]